MRRVVSPKRCHACNQISTSAISNYCTQCNGLFVEYMKPCIREARRRISARLGYSEARKTPTWCNSRELSVCINEVDDKFHEDIVEMFIDELLRVCGMEPLGTNEYDDYIPITYKHLTIEFTHREIRIDYYPYYMCRFVLYGRADSLYKTTLMKVMSSTQYIDLAPLTNDIVDDLVAYDPIYVIRYLIAPIT